MNLRVRTVHALSAMMMAGDGGDGNEGSATQGAKRERNETLPPPSL